MCSFYGFLNLFLIQKQNDSYFLKHPEGLKQSLFIEEKMLRVLLCLNSVSVTGVRRVCSLKSLQKAKTCRFCATLQSSCLSFEKSSRPAEAMYLRRPSSESPYKLHLNLQAFSRVPLISYEPVDISSRGEKT